MLQFLDDRLRDQELSEERSKNVRAINDDQVILRSGVGHDHIQSFHASMSDLYAWELRSNSSHVGS
jgi:hypothetical protein